MKKTYTLLAIVSLMAFIVMPTIIKAQDKGAPKDDYLRSLPEKARQEMLSEYKERQDNAKNNQNLRNNSLESRASSTRTMMNGSTTRPWNASSTMMRENASTTRATSTMPFRGQDDEKCEGMPGQKCDYANTDRGQRNEDVRGYVNNGRAMLLNLFNLRKHGIANELQKAINNLTNIRARLQAHIEKATVSGRDMTKAKAALVIADGKIATAQSAINAILNLSATTTTAVSTSTASTTEAAIDLNKPRLLAFGAQKAIKDAQRALNDVVVAIAHSMGLKVGINGRIASTTATTTIATSTNVVSTTTTTTTP